MFGDFSDLLRRLSLDVTGLANKLRVVFDSAPVQGELLTGTMLSGTSTLALKHGLRRPALGAWVLSASSAGAFTCDPPTVADSVTIRASAPVGSDVSLTVWCC